VKKILTILRGLPGSGKSTAIRRLTGHPVVFSADHFFLTKDGTYNFDPARIGEAQTACQQACLRAMTRGEPHVVVDNTNTRKWEYSLYQAMSDIFGYKVVIIDLYDGGKTDEELAARNQHGVPLDKIALMRSRYER
jgi:predicted kinase